MGRTDAHPTIDDIRRAAERLTGVALRTPLLESERLNKRVGARLLLKCETFQPVGAFKIRGAWNMMSQLTAAERKSGVVAFSSGNHAQAVAWCGRRLDMATTIVMPSDAPDIKIANTRSLGADVILYDRMTDDREAIAAEFVNRTGAIIVPPYDHREIIAGQGTVGLEVVSQCADLRVVPDVTVVPCSGGGLIAGCAIALKDAHPDTEIYAAEPEKFDDTAKSLIAGTRVVNPAGAASICDALLVPTPGNLTFDINRKLLSGGLAVSEQNVRNAVYVAFADARVVVEPGGAAALAAILADPSAFAGKTVCIVLSGGNADPDLFADILRNARIDL